MENEQTTLKESFSTIYEKEKKKILNLAHRILGNLEAAEDITQETFIQAYNNLHQFKGDSDISTWLYTIARNLCFRSLREVKKTNFSDLEALIHQVAAPLGERDFSEPEKVDLIDQVKEGCLTGLLKCLSISQRTAFILNVLFKISIKDTAIIIEKSEGATKGLIFRARQNLKDFLCNNCSLYNPHNNCRCENLIHFSLQQGWIKKPSGKTLKDSSQVNIDSVQEDLDDLKKIVTLYRTLSWHEPSENLKNQIKSKIF